MPAAELPATPRRKVPVPVWIACAIEVVSALIFIVFSLLTLGQQDKILDAVRQQHPQGIDPSQYPSYVHTVVLVTVIIGVVFGLLYILFAWFMVVGRNWARIALTVFTVIGVAYDLYAGGSSANYLGLLIGVAAVVLVYLPASRAHFVPAGPAR
jgi:hypothetical protein